MTKIQQFQRSRKRMIAGLIIGLLGIIFYILNSLYNVAPQSTKLPVILMSTGIALVTYMLYQCPYCKKYPEDGDVPTLNPKECANCKGSLK